jgi:hypothetical protein
MTVPTNPGIGGTYLAEARRRLAACHAQIRHCLAQLDDAQVWWRPLPEMNSIANLVLHLCGNLRQWIIAGVVGAMDNRQRPQEFAERSPILRDELLQRLDAVVREAHAVLAGTADPRLLESRRIQGFDETVLSAIFASLVHLGGHTQEIVHLTRWMLGSAYQFAWIPMTEEQGAPAEEETIAMRDAVFGAGIVPTIEPEPPKPQLPSPPTPRIRRDSPLADPLHELQQEFQDQENEGKL